MTPERLLEHAEAVRVACQTHRKLQKLDKKVAAGHQNLKPMAERLASRLGRAA